MEILEPGKDLRYRWGVVRQKVLNILQVGEKTEANSCNIKNLRDALWSFTKIEEMPREL